MRAIKKIIAIILILIGLFFALGGIATMGDDNGMAGSVIMVIIGGIALVLAALIWKSSRSKTAVKPEKPAKVEKSEPVQPKPETPAPQEKAQSDTYAEAMLLDKQNKTMPDTVEPWHDYQDAIARLDEVVKQTEAFSDLTPLQLFYLHQLHSTALMNDTDEYWIDWNIDSRAVAQLYLDKGYAEYSPVDLWDYTVVQLKEMLAAKGAKKSGTKDELIDRVEETYSRDELVALNPEPRIGLTHKGYDACSVTPYTALRDFTVEHDILCLILQGKYKDARKTLLTYLDGVPFYSKQGNPPKEYRLDACPFLQFQKFNLYEKSSDNAIFGALCALHYMLHGELGLPMYKDESSWVAGKRRDDVYIYDAFNAPLVICKAFVENN